MSYVFPVVVLPAAPGGSGAPAAVAPFLEMGDVLLRALVLAPGPSGPPALTDVTANIGLVEGNIVGTAANLPGIVGPYQIINFNFIIGSTDYIIGGATVLLFVQRTP
jgi:hypothetical protein